MPGPPPALWSKDSTVSAVNNNLGLWKRRVITAVGGDGCAIGCSIAVEFGDVAPRPAGGSRQTYRIRTPIEHSPRDRIGRPGAVVRSTSFARAHPRSERNERLASLGRKRCPDGSILASDAVRPLGTESADGRPFGERSVASIRTSTGGSARAASDRPWPSGRTRGVRHPYSPRGPKPVQ